MFFKKVIDSNSDNMYRQYMKLFPRRSNARTVYLEASPQYLLGGREVAEAIKSVLPEVKLIFLLRDPTERLISSYKSQNRKTKSIIGKIDFDSFVSRALATAGQFSVQLTQENRAFRRELMIGQYADHLPHYLAVFDPDQIAILFFDDLKEKTGDFMRTACEFAGLDYSPYQGYTYTIENRTRSHRSSYLRNAAERLNSRFEPILNRLPKTRKFTRQIYNSVNARSDLDIVIGEKAVASVREYFHPYNLLLGNIMDKYYPNCSRPKWLSFD